jgi:hypothetical protein
MRSEVKALINLGSLPREREATVSQLQAIEAAYKAISRPVSNEEARALIVLFGEDGCFGLASALMHLIETAPDWPLVDCLRNSSNPWLVELRERAVRGGYSV